MMLSMAVFMPLKSRLLLLLLLLPLLSCKDDAAIQPDGPSQPDGPALTDVGAADRGDSEAMLDQAVDINSAQDQPAPPDLSPSLDLVSGELGHPKLLNSKHTGWRKKRCVPCHALQPWKHVANKSPQCASCHGANGACKPNGTGSSKQNHKIANDCQNCHKGEHSFSKNSECTSCHFAKAGLQDC